MASRLLQKSGLKLKCQTTDQDLLQKASILPMRFGINYKQYQAFITQQHSILPSTELISIFDSVYLGDYEDACNFDKLLKAGITNIINCDPINCENLFPRNFSYHNIEMKDNTQFDITRSIEQTIKFVRQILKNNGKVFIHCSKGISRAPAMTLAFIIAEKQMNVSESLKFLKSKYQKADPNLGFIIQLNDFYERGQKVMAMEI